MWAQGRGQGAGGRERARTSEGEGTRPGVGARRQAGRQSAGMRGTQAAAYLSSDAPTQHAAKVHLFHVWLTGTRSMRGALLPAPPQRAPRHP